jgi:predicted nucleotidyltransferase
VDLIIEFSKRVSLLTISSVKVTLEEMLNLDVDIVHGPLKETDLLEVENVVELYAT